MAFLEVRVVPGTASLVEARDVEVVPQAGPVARPDDETLVRAPPGVEDLLGLDEPVAAAQAVQARDVGVLVGEALAPVAGGWSREAIP